MGKLLSLTDGLANQLGTGRDNEFGNTGSPGSSNIQLSGNSPVLKSKAEVFPGAPFNAIVVPTFAFSAKLFK